MKIVDNTCPSCGAQLKMDRIRRTAHCDYCGGDFALDEPLNESEQLHMQTEKRQEEVRKKLTESHDDTNYAMAALMMLLDRIMGSVKRILGTILIIIVLIIVAVIISKIM